MTALDTHESTEPTLVDDHATPADTPTGSQMRVEKRNGNLEPVDVNKIVRAVERCANGLTGVDSLRVATRTISALRDGATTEELDALSIRTAAALISEEPSYSRLAARLLSTVIDKEVTNQDIHSFSQSVAAGHRLGIIGDATATFVADHARKLNDAIVGERTNLFEFFGLRTVYDRYLLRHPQDRLVVETPQYFMLRVCCGLATSPDDALALYDLMSNLEYLPSSPTLFNSGTTHEQMSSCYLLDSPLDELDDIYTTYGDIARLSKHAGGIGVAFSRVRSRGSLIQGTNGLSNGIVPWLKTLDSSVSAVNQGGRRKGAACVYLETWHADVEEFLELRDNTGDDGRRVRHINIANWVPDLFMERVEQDWMWSLFDPKVVPELVDLYGERFREAYLAAESAEKFERQVPARQLYARMMRTLAETGNGWMTFKDPSNERCNQTALPGRTVHLSNLCTEILEVTSDSETAVCNLGSVNLGRLVRDGAFDFEALGRIVAVAVPFLDRVIDRNYYPTPRTAVSNAKWRPVGLGMMGLQDVFFQLGLPFDSEEARDLSRRISEELYFHALLASTHLAEKSGPHETYPETRAAAGDLQFDLWGVTPSDPERWESLRQRIRDVGLRNSLLIAIAPTATIAAIAGCGECIEPQVSNLFKRETLSGEFLQVNGYLVRELQQRGLWTEDMRAKIKRGDGSVQEIEEIPADLRHLFRTAWEIPMRSLIDMGAERGAFIDQSQSLNLFVGSPTIGKLSSMYLHAWKAGLKTTYYLRSRPATRIATTTTTTSDASTGTGAVASAPSTGTGAPASTGAPTSGPATSAPTLISTEPATNSTNSTSSTTPAFDDEAAIACSLENPETCEACD